MKKLYLILIICISTAFVALAQTEFMTLRTSLVLNKSVIIDDDNGFYFENDLDPSKLYELTYSRTSDKWTYEVGFGFLEIVSSIAHRYNIDQFGYGRGAVGEIYNYFYFPLRLKRNLPVTSWFSILPGIETGLMYVTDDNFFNENETACFNFGGPFLSCSSTDTNIFGQPVLGLGLNISLDFKIYKFGLTIFGKRDWRSQKGHGLTTTTQIIRKLDQAVVNEHVGVVRPSLHTWNIGLGISYQLN